MGRDVGPSLGEPSSRPDDDGDEVADLEIDWTEQDDREIDESVEVREIDEFTRLRGQDEGEEDEEEEESKYVTKDYPSKLTMDDIIRVAHNFGITNENFSMMVPNPLARAHNPPPGHIAVYIRCLRWGLTFPLHPTLKSICEAYKISPAQLGPNFYSTFSAMFILWKKKLDAVLSPEEFMHAYQLRNSPMEGFFYPSSWPRSSPLVPPIICGKPSSSHDWKPLFFFLGGDFHVHPLDGPEPIPVICDFHDSRFYHFIPLNMRSEFVTNLSVHVM